MSQSDPSGESNAPFGQDPTVGIPAGGQVPRAAAGLPAYIGPYRILGKLGEGGMGIVYKAEQPSPRRIVALKVIRPGMVDLRHQRRFEIEAEVLGRLQHPGIAQIYEAGIAASPAGDQPFFAMELVEGATLMDYARSAGLDLRQRLGLLLQICDAVHYAHQKGVIHRDLKPGNILVGGDGTPKVLDFGVARLTDAGLQATSIQTGVDQLIGTLPYMSPEQAGGSAGDLDIRSDVYALGVVAYELLSGRRPYDLEKRALAEAIRIIREEEPTALSSIDRGLRGDVETIIAKALSKERERRYASVWELAGDIRRHLADEPIVARPPSAWYQLAKFARRNRAMVAGAAATVVVLVAGIIISSGLAVRLKHTADHLRIEQGHTLEKKIEADTQRDLARRQLALSYVDAARLARDRGAWQLAADHYARAIEAGAPDRPLLRIRYGEALASLARWNESMQQIQLARQEDAAGQLRGLLSFYRVGSGEALNGDQIEQLFREALAQGLPPAESELAQAWLSDTAPQTILHLRRCLRSDPFNSSAHALLALALALSGQLEEAVTEVQMVALLRPQDEWARFVIGMVEAMRSPEDLQRALQTRLAELAPEDRALLAQAAAVASDMSALLAGQSAVAGAPEQAPASAIPVFLRFARLMQSLMARANHSPADASRLAFALPRFVRPARDWLGTVMSYSAGKALGLGVKPPLEILDRLDRAMPSAYISYIRAQYWEDAEDWPRLEEELVRAQQRPGFEHLPAVQRELSERRIIAHFEQFGPAAVPADVAGRQQALKLVREHVARWGGFHSLAAQADIVRFAAECGEFELAQSCLAGLRASFASHRETLQAVEMLQLFVEFKSGNYHGVIARADRLLDSSNPLWTDASISEQSRMKIRARFLDARRGAEKALLAAQPQTRPATGPAHQGKQ